MLWCIVRDVILTFLRQGDQECCSHPAATGGGPAPVTAGALDVEWAHFWDLQPGASAHRRICMAIHSLRIH